MKKINNKGFTLVELLAVLVILVAIMSIAIPSIFSSIERSKSNQDEGRKKVIIAAAEVYVTDNKNTIYNTLTTNSKTECYIELTTLTTSGYLDNDQIKDSNGDVFNLKIIYNKTNSEVSLTETTTAVACIS